MPPAPEGPPLATNGPAAGKPCVEEAFEHSSGEKRVVRKMSYVDDALVCFIVSLPVFGFLMCFSTLGYGGAVYRGLSSGDNLAYYLIAAFIFLVLFMYLFDVQRWQNTVLKKTMYALTLCVATIGVGVSAKDMPEAPIVVYSLAVPVYFFVCKRNLFKFHLLSSFLSSLSIALLICGILVLVYWVCWWFIHDKYWSGEYRDEVRSDMECPGFDNDGGDESDSEEQEGCAAAFLVWFSPCICGMSAVIFGVVTFLLSQQKSVGQEAKIFAFMAVLLLSALWIMASIAGAGMGLQNVVAVFSLVGLILLFGIVGGTLGWDKLKEKLKTFPLLSKMDDLTGSDWVKAAFVLTCILPFLAYLVLSFIKNMIGIVFRKEDSKGWFTESVQVQVNQMQTWNWASISMKVMWLAMIFIGVEVGVGKLTTLFLSWLGDQLEPLSLIQVVVIFVFVGLIMFLLPPVPGVPVYLTGGIVMTQAAEGDGMGFFPGLFVSSFVCLGIKLMAIVMQQKCIGEQLGSYITVRKLVSINSISIRAIKKILSEPGMHISKVAILVGGPDWPTSVLTGILGLNVFEMLLGSLPVMLLIIPTACAGGFQLKKAESETWSSVANVALAIAAFVQGVALAAALYYIDQVATLHHDELCDPANDDLEVKALEAAESERQEHYKHLTDWNRPKFPWLVKVLLVVSAFCAGFSTYTFYLFSEDCFQTFNVTDKISCLRVESDREYEYCLSGNALNLVKPLGWVATLVYTISLLGMYAFFKWADHEMKTTEVQTVTGTSNGVNESVEAPDSPDAFSTAVVQGR